MLKKKKFVIGGIIILIAIVVLAYMGFQAGATYYYSVGEVLGKADTLYSKTIKVGGEVAPGVQQELGKPTHFTIIDIPEEGRDTATNRATLSIIYNGSLPDTFQVGWDVIVEGQYTQSGVFEAKSIITKCPSKYEPAQ